MDRIAARRWLGLSVLVCLGGCSGEISKAPAGDDAAESEQLGAAEEALTTPVSVVVLPSQDTTVRLSAPNKNFGTTKDLDINRTLVQFDTAAIKAAIGATDVLVSAKFELTLTNNSLRRTTAKRQVDVFRLNKQWTEKGATWFCAIDTNTGNSLPNCTTAATAWSMGALPPNPWTAPATASITIAATQTGIASFDVTADVKKFVSNQATNYGWMLKGSTAGEFAEFAARESTTPPRLVLSVRRCNVALCDDGNACTADSCDATASCVHKAAANGTVCSDGNACTNGDVCTAGACGAGAPVVCAAVDACHPASCNPSDGTCSVVTACAIQGVGNIPGNTVGGLDVSPEVLEGGFLNDQVSAFGSAIAYTGVDDLYIATPDRGPADGTTTYADRFYLIDLSIAGGTVTPTLLGGATLNKSPGVTFLGKNTEFDATNSTASRRFDPEGVRVSPTGTFYVSDEYGPFVYEFAANGDRIRALAMPSRFLITNPALEAAELPPANTSGRQANRGMEGLAISPDGKKLFGMMQNPLIQDGGLDAANKRVGLNNRILEIDTTTGATREFLYKLADKAYGVSEIIAVNDHQFLVIERDSLIGAAAVFKRLMLIDTTGATDISGIAALPVTDTPAGVTPVAKTPFLDLLAPEFGLAGASFPEKIEGLAFGPDLSDGRHVLVVTNDNDGNVAQANNFYVFAIGAAALPNYAPQNATFASACEAATCDAADACHKDGLCNPGTAACSAPLQPVGTECGTDQTCDAAGACLTNAHVVINEIESNGDAAGDWVELYNAGSAPVDVSGYIVKDNDNTHVVTISAGTPPIAAGAYLVVTTDIAPFNVGLGAADSARLFTPGLTLVDTYSWTAHALTTYGRCPNGSGAFTTSTSATKGAANDCSVAIKINEVESNGDAAGDWVELYNAGLTPVDVSGYIVKDNDDTHVVTIAAGTPPIAPGAYLVVTTDIAPFNVGLGAADSARLFTPTLTLVDTYTWTAHAPVTYARCPNGSGAFQATATATKGTANDCSVTIAIKINEIESNGDAAGDWVELYNAGVTAVDVSGYIVKDNDDAHVVTIPAATPLLAPGAYLVVTTDIAPFNVGLGAADSARLFTPTLTLLDTYVWTAHATFTYARCPNGSGAFAQSTAATKGFVNACVGDAPPLPAWPGSSTFTTIDGATVFGADMSGLFYEPATATEPAVLWAVRNGTGTLFRLLKSGALWTPDADDGWSAGKLLKYTDGLGRPDSEGVTRGEYDEPFVYVATERNNDNNGVSRLSVLRFDTSGSIASLTALDEWNLTSDLPVVGPNLGLEAIAYYPDSQLVAKSFRDDNTLTAYVPSDYPDHGEGLFFVGVEATGMIYAYALYDDGAGGYARIASFSSGMTVNGLTSVMDLALDREVGYLWAQGDDTLSGMSTVFDIDTTPGSLTLGRFVPKKQFARPAGMPNINNEGFAIAPESECASGVKPVFWSDDGQTDGHALRQGSIPCGAFVP